MLRSAPPPTTQPAERPLHVKRVKGRWYWDPPDKLRRSHGLKTKPLGADQSLAWSFAEKLNAAHLGLGPGQPTVGSVRWVLESFLESERFTGLAPATQRDYRWLARAVLVPISVGNTTLGALQALALKPRHADAIYADLVEQRGRSTAHYACRLARRVWHWAARREMVDAANPWSGMELRTPEARTAIWRPEQVDAVVAAANAAGRPSIGLATLLGYWLGHRQADVLGLTWQALDAEQVATRKTRKTLPVAVEAYPTLAAAIATAKARAPQAPAEGPSYVVLSERTARQYNRHTFGHEWREIATAAGIPITLQYRDLRATAMTQLSDAGADMLSITTHSGHTTPQMARRYARPTTAQFERAATARVEFLARTPAKKR